MDGRWSQTLVHRTAELCDLDRETADRVFGLLDDASCWLLGPSAGSWTIRVPPGPRCSGGRAAFLKLAPGASVERQKPRGEERLLVLRGRLRREDGREAREGELVVRSRGERQTVTAVDAEECICLVVSGPPATRH